VDRAVLRALARRKPSVFSSPTRSLTMPDAFDLDRPSTRRLRVAWPNGPWCCCPQRHPPLDRGARAARVAIIGPNATAPKRCKACYSFANHVLAGYPDMRSASRSPPCAKPSRPHSLLWRTEARGRVVQGCEVDSDDTRALAGSRRGAACADVVVMVVATRPLFGRGTMGEGNDCESLELPGVQRQLVEEVVAAGTPVALVLLTGRPYAISWALDGPLPGRGGAPSVLPWGGRRPCHRGHPDRRVTPPADCRSPCRAQRGSRTRTQRSRWPIGGHSTDPRRSVLSASACRTPGSATPNSASTGWWRQAPSSPSLSPSQLRRREVRCGAAVRRD